MKTNVFNSKKFLSLFLALVMVLGMLPMTAFATGEVANVWVGGQQMTVGGSISDSSGGTATLTKDGDNYILTLDNFSYEGEGHVYADGYDCAGIYAEQNLIINLKGTNTINVSGNRNAVHGIAVRGYQTGLIIDSGDQTDSLTVTSDGPEFIRGIYAEEDLMIQGNGTVTAQGGSNTTGRYACVGIGARQINLSGNGKIYAIGGNSARSSSGIEMEWMMSHGECLNISGNVTVMASGGTAGRDLSCGIVAPNANITGGKVTATGSKVTGEETYDSIGIFLRSDFGGSTLNIQDSTVTAIGDSYGIQVRSDNGSRVLNIQNSTVTAESSNQAVDASISTGEEQWYQWRDTVDGSFNNGPLNYNQNSYLQICPVPLTCNLWVDGVEVTSAKTSGEGWSYDKTTGTLTLNGATITGSYDGGYPDHSAGIYAAEELNIVLKGSNTISGGNCGIYADAALNISGDGSLTATGEFDGIKATGDITISGGTVTANGTYSYGICAEEKVISITGGYVVANGGGSSPSAILANIVVLGNSSHLKVAHNSVAVSGALSATGGLCRTSADGDFSDAIVASGTYFEYTGSDHVTYTYKDAQNHTVACAHGISFDATHEYENGVCVCTAEDPMYGCDFIVTGDTANYSWDKTNKVLTINGGTVTVSNKDKNTATSHRINIQGIANVTLDGVNISTNSGAPIEIRDHSDTNVTLTLSGSNTLISQADEKAALHKSRGQQATSSDAATLTINGSGSLTAVGGNNAAGIGGGGHRGDTHNIIINSGTISATGKGWAAGIGSSDDGSTWNIVINGGNVTANGMPGIGANTDNWQGVKDASITGGMVTTNSYKGSTPTGGLVSTDGGKTFTVYSDYTLSQDLTIATDGKLTVAEGAELTVADGFTLTNKGVIVNDGTISGNLVNEGTIYNKGTLPANVGGTVYEQYVKVNNGSGTGNYTEGSTVTITADAPASGMMFTGWTIELGTITLTDIAKAETTFTMPEGCVIVKANYADIVATVTDSIGNVKYYSDEFFAQNEWYNAGGTLTLYTDLRLFHSRFPANGVLDLNRHTMQTDMLIIDQSCTIQNGTISIWHEGIVEEDAVVTFKNVTITNDEHSSREIEITNNGTIVDEGLTLNGVTISGAAVKTGLTEDRVTLSGIPTEGYVYDGTAHEPSVKCGETTLVAGTDYTVTFSNSNGGDSTVNAGTITMTITGIGNYTGTVTKTYTITDTTAPTGTILVKENSWREFWNWISFGLFCKDHVDVTITADGTGSNVTKVEYLLSGTVLEENNIPAEGWTALTKDGDAYKFRIQPKSKVAVYIRITDEGGNVTVINSNGIVVYEDSEAVTTLVNYTFKENSDKDIAVTLNGNTVKSVVCAGAELTSNTHYTIAADGTITLKVAYLNTLDCGSYTFTVSYNPMGVENSGVTDLTTTFIVHVEPTSIVGVTVNVSGTFTYDGNAKTPDPVVVLNGETLIKDQDYTVSYANNVNAGQATVTVTGMGNYTGSANSKYEIAKREITITAEAKNTIANTALPFYTYKVEGLVGEDTLVTEPTLTSNVNITVIGEYDITATGADAGNNYSIKYVSAKLTVLADSAVDAAVDYTEELKDYDSKAVTSEDKDELQDMLDEINTILADENITTNGKNAMEEVKKQVEDLIKAIDDAAKATDTENTGKVEDVTVENVTTDDKTDLEKAKADLEKALEDNGGNYTEAEKKAIEDELKLIDDALNVIENVEAVEDAISDLPATVEPDDEEAVAKIEAAKKAYNELTDYEKSLVDPETKDKLDKLTNGIVAYDIVKGDGSSWTQGTDGSVTFTVNGPISKFSGIKIDGKAVDAQYYDIKAGSTIITLKASYLETLAAGEHSITVVYTDGETSGTFDVQTKSTSPATGDNSNMFLWIALFFISGGAMITLTVVDRKRKAEKR